MFFWRGFQSDTHLDLKTFRIQAVEEQGKTKLRSESVQTLLVHHWFPDGSLFFRAISQFCKRKEPMKGFSCKCYHPALALLKWGAVDAACTAGGGGELRAQRPVVGGGLWSTISSSPTKTAFLQILTVWDYKEASGFLIVWNLGKWARSLPQAKLQQRTWQEPAGDQLKMEETTIFFEMHFFLFFCTLRFNLS